MHKPKYTLLGEIITSNLIFLAVLDPYEKHLGEALITPDQLNNPKIMDQLINDMEIMRSKGIEEVIIDIPEEMEARNEKK